MGSQKLELKRRHYPRPGQALLSPLRFPGSKRKQVGYLKQVIEANEIRPDLYIEPFAGGASVALQLLCDEQVGAIALADVDNLISSFWKCVFFDTEWLVDAIEDVDVSLETWDRFKQAKPRSTRDRALKCLFLNRTSFSGIIGPSAGPIGGRKQESDYPISCRFPKPTVIKRIVQASTFRARVLFVKQMNWTSTLMHSHALDNDYGAGKVLLYLDPPFFDKAKRLYTHYFSSSDHLELHKALASEKLPWILSYDPAPEILDLYRSNGTTPKKLALLYTTAASGSNIASELVITNLAKLPNWRRSGSYRPHGRKTHDR